MLSTHHNPERLRRATNLIPGKLGMATRPGAQQIVAGAVGDAVAWGNRLLLEKQGRIALWDGNAEVDIAPAGKLLQGTTFQALTANAQREDRFYVADGLRPIWYIARRTGAWVREDVVNKVKDSSGVPYPIPVPIAVESWRNRLWIAFGTNRAQHCQNDDTAYWDPLWTVECQGAESDKINALRAHGTSLIAGLSKSLWALTGDSQFNFTRDPVTDGAGSAGPNSLVSDGVALLGASNYGIHALGRAQPLSDDLTEIFQGGLYPVSCALDTKRRLLLVAAAGRLLVMSLDKPGLWGEIAGARVTGVVRMRDYVGWYGDDGVWILSARDTADAWLDGKRTPVRSDWETWDELPNVLNGGRARLSRNTFLLAGSTRGSVTYSATVDDGASTFTTQATLADSPQDLWTDAIAGLAGEPWPSPPVRREFTPQLAGQRFVRRLTADCHMEVRLDLPKYHFPKPKKGDA